VGQVHEALEKSQVAAEFARISGMWHDAVFNDELSLNASLPQEHGSLQLA